MAVHAFTYEFWVKRVDVVARSDTDPTPIVCSVTADILATDKADDTKTIWMEETVALTHTHLQPKDLPSGFIPVASVTNEKLYEWFTANMTADGLDAYTTWKLYGWEEVDPTREE